MLFSKKALKALQAENEQLRLEKQQLQNLNDDLEGMHKRQAQTIRQYHEADKARAAKADTRVLRIIGGPKSGKIVAVKLDPNGYFMHVTDDSRHYDVWEMPPVQLLRFKRFVVTHREQSFDYTEECLALDGMDAAQVWAEVKRLGLRTE